MGEKILCFAFAMLIPWSDLYVQARKSFNVIDFGAVGDEKTDDSQAFAKAWEAVCGERQRSELMIPNGKTFLLKPVNFEGPCKSTNIVVKILGHIVAPNNRKAFKEYHPSKWMLFSDIDGLTVDGGGSGLINGNGRAWWKTCPAGDSHCPERPTTFRFNHCNNLKLQHLKFMDSPANFITLGACHGVEVSQLHIQAPENSPNTDGINIVGSTQVFIHDSFVGTGDDCIAINNHAYDVNITQFSCGPGHGISIGSLGDDTVERVRVWNSNITGVLGGVKIKTWQGGKGFARNIIYENIRVIKAKYPILIDQYYCPNKSCTIHKETSAIKISDVTYKNIVGTSATAEAITFNCSKTFGCKNIQIDQINLISAIPRKRTYTQCINAQGQSGTTIPKINCLEKQYVG